MRHRLTEGLYLFGWTVVKLLPERLARVVFRLIADVVWWWRPEGVQRLEANLRLAVGPDAGDARLAELARAGMRSYMRYWMEAFRLSVWDERKILAGVHAENEESLSAILDSGRGAIIVGSHSANGDLAGAWLALRGYAPMGVAERLKPESLFDRFVAYRAALGIEILPTGDGRNVFAALAERLRAGGVVMLAGDRGDLARSGVEVDFFGSKARMPAGPARLALSTGAALVPVTLWYEDETRMGARLEPEIPVPTVGTDQEKIAVVTQAMADALAAGIAAHPEDWHMLQRAWHCGAGGRRASRLPFTAPRIRERSDQAERRSAGIAAA